MIPSQPLHRREFLAMSTMSLAAALSPGLAQAPPPTETTPPPPYSLPKLPYAYNALEPHIDEQTMNIHHTKHHATYLNNLNTELAKFPVLAKQPLPSLLANLPSIPNPSQTILRNHGGGHWNHSFFWESLTPPSPTNEPSEELAVAIQATFENPAGFKKAFSQAAASHFGSGWAWLILQNKKLVITTTANQDNPLMRGIIPDSSLGTPLLGIDLWEHAYYLHYQNVRANYIHAFFEIINWTMVSKRFSDAN